MDSHLISLSKFNLSHIGTFTWHTPPGPYRATTFRGRELNYGSRTYFFDHIRTWRVSPDEYQPNADTNMKDNTHQAHTQSSQQGEYGMIITTAKWYSGTVGPKVSWHLSYRWGKPRKNLTQETCPERGSNPGPLRDKRSCYHLLHRGGPKWIECIKINSNMIAVRSIPGRFLNGTRCRHGCPVTETLAHVLGQCDRGMLIRNSFHHGVSSLIAIALKKRGWSVEEEIFCLASNYFVDYDV